MHLYYHHTVYSLPLYTFLWPEDGQQWPKHVVVSIIKWEKRQFCFDVPHPLPENEINLHISSYVRGIQSDAVICACLFISWSTQCHLITWYLRLSRKWNLVHIRPRCDAVVSVSARFVPHIVWFQMVRRLMNDEPEVAGRKSRWNKDSVTA